MIPCADEARRHSTARAPVPVGKETGGLLLGLMLAAGLQANDLPAGATARIKYLNRVAAHFDKYHVKSPLDFLLLVDPEVDGREKAYIKREGNRFIILVHEDHLLAADKDDLFTTVAHELCHAYHDGFVIDVWDLISVPEKTTRHIVNAACIARVLAEHKAQHGNLLP